MPSKLNVFDIGATGGRFSNFWSDEMLVQLGTTCPNMTSLKLTSVCKITNVGFRTIVAHCHGLEFLWVEDYTLLTPPLLIQLTTAFPRLRELSLKGAAVTDEVMGAIAHNLPLLEYLDVSACDGITSVGLRLIADALRSLRTLKLGDVGWGRAMTDAVLARLTENCCATLTYINLQRCEQITDVGAAHLANCHKLIDVNVYRCFKLSGVGITAIVEGCPEIERLNVSYCRNVDDDLLAEIGECSKHLKYFRTNSSQISDTGILEFVGNCPLLCDVEDASYCANVSEATKAEIELMCASRR
jgi:F-box/leucine-rich repeat protein 2/20